MADTYEKDLAQKSSLTTSDYIRVVGSDNVSYKQPMTDLMTTTGIARTLTTTGVDLNTLTPNATSGNGYYRGNDISAMTNRPSAEINAFPWALNAINVNSYIKQILHVYTAQAKIVVYERIQRYSSGSTVWGNWEKMPTRAEIDALNSKTRVEISSTYASYIIVYKRGNVGFIRISNPKNLPANTTTDIGTIPEGYRPAWEMVTFMNERGASTGIGLTLTTAGLIRIYNYSTNTGTLNINEVFSYPIA